MKNVKKFEDFSINEEKEKLPFTRNFIKPESNKDNDSIEPNNSNFEPFGVVNIHIDGEGWIKNAVIQGIKKTLSNYQGERHLFVDGKEVNPYSTGGIS